MHCYGRAAKRRRDRKYKRKLKRLYSFGTITPAIWYVDADYPYKKVSNRKARYYKGDLPNGNVYKKLFDLWWQIY